jgi:hypothetical protein
MTRTTLFVAVVALSVVAVRAGASAPLRFGDQTFSDPANVDNRWLTLTPGMRSSYVGATSDGAKRVAHRIVTTVTDLTKVVAGVRTRVVWERDFSAGELVEAELAFFAQDDAGNVWHAGEYPEEYEQGSFVRAPAWLHGLKGARAGLAMQAVPRPGSTYAEGYAPPPVNWTDHATVEARGLRVCVPLNCFENVLRVAEFNPDEPGRAQLKYYAPGLGTILVGWRGRADEDKETLGLVERTRLNAAQLSYARKAALKLERHAYRVSAIYRRTPPARVG